MNRLLVICGPTATGKTDLGIYLAKKFGGEIISADSRQVYKNMDIGTGKEYSEEVKIWGYDLVLPNEEFSVAHFQKYATEKIVEIRARGKLPILVGGTGLYIKAVTHGIGTAEVPINTKLRTKLSSKNVEELYEMLLKVNRERALSLNESDSKNPRRLVRAIEISLNKDKMGIEKNNYDVLQIGLTADLEFLYKNVEESVEKRFEGRMVDEVKSLIESGLSLEAKSMSATGYGEIVKYLKGEISLEEALARWKLSERQYVKRQLTWFKKMQNIHWFDITQKNFRDRVAERVEKWDNTLYESKN